jgi:hypothetical protein
MYAGSFVAGFFVGCFFGAVMMAFIAGGSDRRY